MFFFQLNVLNKAGLSKDNFENSESRVMEDTRQTKIDDCFNSSRTSQEEDLDSLWTELGEDDDFNFEESPSDQLQANTAKRLKLD